MAAFTVSVGISDAPLKNYANQYGYDIKSIIALRSKVKESLEQFIDTAVQQGFERAYQDGYVVDIHNVSVQEEYDNGQNTEED